jgi:hypothetical protein
MLFVNKTMVTQPPRMMDLIRCCIRPVGKVRRCGNGDGACIVAITCRIESTVSISESTEVTTSSGRRIDEGGVRHAVSVARVDDGEEANETKKAIGRVVCYNV